MNPESQKSVTPSKTAKSGLLVMPGMTLGVQPPMAGVEAAKTADQKSLPPPVPVSSIVPAVQVGKGKPQVLAQTQMPVVGKPTGGQPQVLPSQMPASTGRASGTPHVIASTGQSVTPAVISRPGEVMTVSAPPTPPAHEVPTSVESYRPSAVVFSPGEREGIALVGRFEPWPWGEIPEEMRLADALEAQGVKIFRLDQYAASPPHPKAAAVLFTGDHFSWGRLPDWSATHLTVVWTYELLSGRVEKTAFFEIAQKAALVVGAERKDARAFGFARYLYLPGACLPAMPDFHPEPKTSCVFVGSLYNARRRAIADCVREAGGEVYENPGRWLSDTDFTRIVQGAKVVVGDHARQDVPGFWSRRTYTVPGAGGFLLTAAAPGLEGEFQPGVHVATYGSVAVLRKALAAYIEDDVQREEIRRAGFAHAREHYTWAARAKTLVGTLRHLDPKVRI